MKTQKTITANDPQRVLKSIEPQQHVSVNISKEGSTSEIFDILKGVQAFIGSFDTESKYKVEMQLAKIESAVNQDGENKQLANA